MQIPPSHSGGPVPTTNTDYPSAAGPNDGNSESLGRGGLIELRFTDNYVFNSGDGDDDVFVREVGPDGELVHVGLLPTTATLGLISPYGGDDNGDGYFEIGTNWPARRVPIPNPEAPVASRRKISGRARACQR